MSEFKRGFKADVRRLVDEVRSDFGVRPLDPLDPFALAAWLCIPVHGISTLELEAGSAPFEPSLPGSFHAVTVPWGSGSLIIHNDFSALVRQRADIAHELGHILLEHVGCAVNVGELGDRDRRIEREADWFGFSLLVTDEAALALARSRLPVDECAAKMGVSEAAMVFRLNASGATKRARAEEARWKNRLSR